MFSEQRADAGYNVESQHAEIPQHADWSTVVTKQTHKTVCKSDQLGLIALAPGGISLQQLGIVKIEISDTITQRRHIAQAKVESLGGDRVQTMCRVAYQDGSRGRQSCSLAVTSGYAARVPTRENSPSR